MFMGSGPHDQAAIYGKKQFKNLLLQNLKAEYLETWYVLLGVPAHHTCSLSDDLRLNLALIIARSDCVGYAFICMGKC